MADPGWNAARVKERGRELGADLVGIASAAMLNAFPPDPRWPQTPERISPYCRSVIVLVQRIPAGAFRCKTNTPVQYIDMLVLRKMDKVAYRLAEELEAEVEPVELDDDPAGHSPLQPEPNDRTAIAVMTCRASIDSA